MPALINLTILYSSSEEGFCQNAFIILHYQEKLFKYAKWSFTSSNLLMKYLNISWQCFNVIIHGLQHGLKKIRNNLLKSGNKAYHKRDLHFAQNHIRWEHWVEAYQWDVNHHGHAIHRHLAESHLFPTTKERMRNQLAEQCLDWEMLNLMKVQLSLTHL